MLNIRLTDNAADCLRALLDKEETEDTVFRLREFKTGSC